MQDQSRRQKRSGYLDFELEVGIGTAPKYPVAVLESPAGEARATMHFPLDDLALENRLLTLQNALLRSGGQPRRKLLPEQQGVQDFGRELFETLFAPEIRSCYDVSLRESVQQRKGLRLKLRIQSPELAALPWEYLWHPGQAEYMSLSTRTPIVRYLEVPQRIQPLAVTPPLHILGMTASPSDLPKLNLSREKQRMARALSDLSARGLVELTWLAGQSWRDLLRAMRQGTYHIFHFIGHGGFDRSTGEGLIVLADQEGMSAHFSATRLGRLLADHDALRLVLLNSCEGARGSEADVFSSTASILVRRGIPAVLAMQYEITDKAAIEFARTFYEALGDGMPVDGAVAEARKAISFAVNNTVEWGTPVLHMRSPDGGLFDVAETERTRRPAPPISEGPPKVDEERAKNLEQLYVDGLSAFWLEDWDNAILSLQALVNQRSDYQDGDAAEKLEEAKRGRKLEALYTQAQNAQVAEDWPTMLSTLEKLIAEEPKFKDVTALLEQAKKQGRLADLYAQAQQLQKAGQWQAVVKVFAQITALAPDYSDPDNLLSTAERELAEQEHSDLYSRAFVAMSARDWATAQQLLTQLQQSEAGNAQVARLLARAEAEIEQGRVLPDQRKRRWTDSLRESKTRLLILGALAAALLILVGVFAWIVSQENGPQAEVSATQVAGAIPGSPEPTSTPLSAPVVITTSRPTATASPAPTATPQPAPELTAPRLAPTTTKPPTPTERPTDTPVPSWTPSPTSTFTATPTHTPRPILEPTQPPPTRTRAPSAMPEQFPAPGLVAPAEGQAFTQWDEVVLEWQEVGQLPADGYYVVTLAYSRFGDTWYDETPWTKNASWTMSEHRYLLDLSDDGQFRWSVQIMRQTGLNDEGNPTGLSSSPVSEQRTLIWRLSGPGSGTPTPPG